MDFKVIPLFESRATKEVAAIADKYKMPGEPDLGVAFRTIYWSHRELWLPLRQKPGSTGAKAVQRSAAKINTATRRYMSVLTDGSSATLAQLLCADIGPPNHLVEDINALTRLLQRLELNSNIAMHAKASRGRRKDQLAVTVASELGQLFDRYSPPSSRRFRRGESHGTIRSNFISDALRLFNLDLTEHTTRTYRETKHRRRVRL